MNYCGIDVGSKELIVRLIRNGHLGKDKTFSNTFEGINSLVKYISGKKIVRVCLEATGIYHQDLTIVLDKAENIEVMLVNPNVSRKFSEALSTRNKTDKVDAGALAEYACRMEFVPWEAPSDNSLKLRMFSRRIVQLTKMKAQSKNQLHALSATVMTPEELISDCKTQIEFYKKNIEKLTKLTVDLIFNCEELRQKFELMISIKGIAETSAIQILGELVMLPNDLTKKQWVAYAGLDPRAYESGTSIKKKSRISKAGNRFLRQALYLPALSAKQHDPHIKAFFEHLVDDLGKKKIQAVCAVMRKLLHAIHGMFKNGTSFNGALFYKMEEAK